MLIGIDECGYGCYAGNLFVGGVRAPNDWKIPGLNDSKKLTHTERAALVCQIQPLLGNTLQYAVCQMTAQQIDELGLGVCHKTAICRVIADLYKEGDSIIMDGNLKPDNILKYKVSEILPGALQSVIKADGKFPAVMAASILIKEQRDELMRQEHLKYPHYGWDHNAGYIVADHLDGIRKYGFTELHRRSYKVKL